MLQEATPYNHAGEDPALAKRILDYLNTEKAEGGTAVSVAVICDDRLLAAAAAGTQDGDEKHPARVDDLYNIGSVSKVYCAMAIMKLVEMGKVALDEPVYRYLPRFRMLDPRYTDITLRMCLSHSSGLPGTSLKNAFCRRWMEPTLFYDDFYDYLSKSQLKAAPGTFSVYCNDGFTLAEMVVVEVSGMTYTTFVQRYITDPVGLISTCTGENNPANRVRVRERGTKQEYLMCLGTGGIQSDLSDCARLGALFLRPNNVLTEESFREIAALQGVSFLPDTFGKGYGLGWDLVNYNSRLFDFGEDVLVKSGGTNSFSSYLVVIPKYRMSAAISVTNDTGLDPLRTLCEICAMAAEAAGKPVTRKEQKKAAEPVAIPAEKIALWDGLYLNAGVVFRTRFSECSLRVETLASSQWEDFSGEMFFDGQAFYGEKMSGYIQEHGDCCYFVQHAALGNMPVAQKFKPFPPIQEDWAARIGKSYVLCDGDPDDLNGWSHGGLILEKLEEIELPFFTNRYLDYVIRRRAILPVDGKTSKMFLDGPGSACSRDAFAPFFYEENGKEYLYYLGYTYRCSEELEELQPGVVQMEGLGKNRAWRIRTKGKLQIEGPADLVAVVMEKNMNIIHGPLETGELPEDIDGYLLLMSVTPGAVSIRFEPV